MKITFVLSSLRLSGGVVLVVEISNRLARRGHEVLLLTPRNTTEAEVAQKIHPDIRVCEASVGLPTAPTLFHNASLLASLVLSVPRSDILVATHTPTTLPVLISSWLQPAKRVWLYMDYPEMFRSRRVERFLLAHMPKCFPRIVAISKPLADQINARAQSEVHVIHPGLGVTPPRDLVAKSTQTGSHLRILYVGDDRPRKGLQEFVQAMKTVQRISPTSLAVIVSKNLCHIPLDLYHEIYIRPDDATLAQQYQECDVLVSTSWGEGLGYPPLEAMAFGKPVIVADSGGAQDYVVDGVNALLVPARDAEAVARAILRLIDDEPLRNQLGSHGRATASRYRWEEAVDQFEQVLQRTIQQ